MASINIKNNIFDCGNIPCGTSSLCADCECKLMEAVNNDNIMIVDIDIKKDVCSIMLCGTGETIIINGFSENAAENGFENRDDVSFLLSGEEKDDIRMIKFRHRNGKYGWYVVYKSKIRKQNGSPVHISGIMCNADTQKKTEESLISRIEFDPLTKVYNRESAKEKIEQCLLSSNGKDYALFVLDLDNFKLINDTFGHLYGDAVLTMAAGCIKSSISEDDIVGRFGGDEFFVFVRNSDDNTIMEKSQKISRTILSMRSNISDDNDISCSIGVAYGTGSGDTYEDMFKKADIALYKSKNSGKNCIVVYTNDMSADEGGALDYERDTEEDESRTQAHDLSHIVIEIAARSTSFQNAVNMIMRHIGVALDVDDVKIMHVNTEKDKISIEYHWSKEENIAQRDNRSGYYLHDDLMNLRKKFEERPLFVVTEKDCSGFSEKYSNELKKLAGKSVVYSSSLTRENSFFMLVLSCSKKERKWTDKQMKTVNEVTKILFMYLSKNYRGDMEVENDESGLEPHTKLLSYDKFFEESERIRKLATEQNQQCAVVHIDFHHMYMFNEIYGIRAGEMILAEYAADVNRAQKKNPDMSVATHIYGTDKFIILVRYGNDIAKLTEGLVEFNNKFSNLRFVKFDKYRLITKIGICRVKAGEPLWKKMDEAGRLKKNRPDPTECVYYLQDDNGN